MLRLLYTDDKAAWDIEWAALLVSSASVQNLFLICTVGIHIIILGSAN